MSSKFKTNGPKGRKEKNFTHKLWDNNSGIVTRIRLNIGGTFTGVWYNYYL